MQIDNILYLVMFIQLCWYRSMQIRFLGSQGLFLNVVYLFIKAQQLLPCTEKYALVNTLYYSAICIDILVFFSKMNIGNC